MQITERPDSLCFSGNIPEIKISGVTDNLKVTLRESGSDALILEEIYTADSRGNISVYIKDVVSARLLTSVPAREEMLYVQENISKTFVLTLGSETFTFTALAGGVYDLRVSVSDFLTGNLLSWQTENIRMKPDGVMFATYYSQEECRFKIEAIVENDWQRSETVEIGYDKCYTINISPAFWSEHFGYKVKSLSVYVETLSGYALTSSVGYIVTDDERLEQYIYINSLGGIDTISFTGKLMRKHSTAATVGKVNARLVESCPEVTVSYKQNTGYLAGDEVELVQEFLQAEYRYHVVNSLPVRIVIEEQENDFTAFELNSYTYEYRHEELPRHIHLRKPLREIPLPPFWDNCRAYFDRKRGNKIIDRKSGLESTIEGEIIHFPEISGYDVFNRTNRSFWLEDMPVVVPGKPRTWRIRELTGLFTVDYSTDWCSRVLFFRDINTTVGSILPIIVYPGLNSTQVAEVVKYLKEYYFLEDGTDHKLLTQEGQLNTLIVEEIM